MTGFIVLCQILIYPFVRGMNAKIATGMKMVFEIKSSELEKLEDSAKHFVELIASEYRAILAEFDNTIFKPQDEAVPPVPGAPMTNNGANDNTETSLFNVQARPEEKRVAVLANRAGKGNEGLEENNPLLMKTRLALSRKLHAVKNEL